MTDRPDLSALEEALGKATPGPWRLDRTDSIVAAKTKGYVAEAYDGLIGGEDFDQDLSLANARAIVLAVNLAPALLAERKRLVRELAEARGTAWQPINNAPQDGTHVDLWITCGKNGRRVTDAYWGSITDASNDEAWPEEGWIDGLHFAQGEDERVTHFRLVLGPALHQEEPK